MAIPQNEGAPAQQQRQTSVIGMVMNIALVYFVYTTFFAKKADTINTATIANSPLTTPVPTSLPAPGESAPSILQMLQGQRASTGPSELAWYEKMRKIQLDMEKNTPKIINQWRNGEPFDLYVFLSRSSMALDDPTSLLAAKDGKQEGLKAASTAPKREFSIKKLMDPNSNLYDLTAQEPTIAYQNATFDGLRNGDGCLWAVTDLTYDWSAENYRMQHFNITLPQDIATNGTLFAHIYLVKHGAALPTDIITPDGFYFVYPLTVALKKKPKKTGVNLLGGGDDAVAKPQEAAFGIGLTKEEAQADEPLPMQGREGEGASAKHQKETTDTTMNYWRPTMHIQILHDFSAYSGRQLPPHVASSLLVLPGSSRYAPVSFVNDFWLLGHQLQELNGSHVEVPLEISFSLQSMWKWALQSQMQASWDMQAAMGTHSEGDSDIFKSVVLETNPILLGITLIVSTLHMVFDMLAFKNDISFWRSAKSMEGLSVRSIVVNLFFQVVILLYLFENDTSWMVLMSSVVGLAIEIWKLRKAVSVGVTWENGWPRLKWEDAEESYALSHTKEYDDIATSHMLYILYPLVVGYAVYSLFFDRHRSWYSWILSSLTGFVYTFGFIQMVPQLYINYRMKSVAHMPWRAMIYKALNTFIDDLFAWVIKMPTLHRLAVFRDDIIFLIYLYQRWVYPVDKSRRNEFGSSAEDYEILAARRHGLVRNCKRDKYEKRNRS